MVSFQCFFVCLHSKILRVDLTLKTKWTHKGSFGYICGVLELQMDKGTLRMLLWQLVYATGCTDSTKIRLVMWLWAFSSNTISLGFCEDFWSCVSMFHVVSDCFQVEPHLCDPSCAGESCMIITLLHVLWRWEMSFVMSNIIQIAFDSSLLFTILSLSGGNLICP